MKVVHLSTIDYGGAYKAAERISESMKMCGVDSRLLVRTKIHQDSACDEIFNNPLEKIVSKVKNVENLLLSKGDVISDYFGTDITQNLLVSRANVIILHWVNSFISYHNVEQLRKLNKKVIWVMHDMWLFTGGCHSDRYCGNYKSGCGECPLIMSNKKNDISRKNFKRKIEMMNKVEVSLVAPSRWLVDCARVSSITKKKKIYCIHNPINGDVFFPKEDKTSLKNKYRLPMSRKIVLFGAMKANNDVNKGMWYLIEALKQLPRAEYAVVIFGNSSSFNLADIDLEANCLGVINDENMLSDIYNCADVFVAPSMQESFGYTICEALSCGIPVVAFPVGGIIDQIEHKVNGYLAEFQNAEDIVRGIEWAINRSEYPIKNLNRLNNNYMEIGQQYIKLCETY